ncbi:MAG: class I SAM-dependent methyltransferase [Thermaurantimonas sp.]
MSTKCDLCGGSDWLVSDITPKAWRSTNEEFNLLVCHTCGLIKTEPTIPKEQIALYYASETYDSHSKNNESKSFFGRVYFFIQKLNFRYKYSVIKKAVNKDTKNCSLLDYGSGNGNFLRYLKSKFLEVRGVEFESNMVEHCRSEGLNVTSEDEFDWKKERFDVITLFHVFEHLYDPDAYFQKFYNAAKDDGILILALPNPESYDCAFYKNDWAAWDVPIHVHHFWQDVIIKYAKKNKYKFLFKKPLYFDAFYVSILSERIRNKNFPLLRGFLVGFFSNLIALFTSQYSSLIYVFKKDQL